MNGQMPTSQPINETPLAKPVETIPVNPSQQNPPNLPEEKHSPVPNGMGKGLLFQIVFLVIALILFFGILNFFNILPISQLWPNQFGFLPHRAYEQATTRPIPQPTQTSTNYSPNTFQYDTEKAKTILNQYVKDTIKPEFLLKSFDIKQGLSIDNRTEDVKYEFGSYFTQDQTTISVNFHYKENTNNPNDFIIFIQLSKVEQKTLTPTLANSLTSSYFINPYTPITNCNTKGTTSYCEEFKTEDEGKKGYGVVFANDQSVSPPKPMLIIFTCFIPKESNDYTTQISCISP